MKPDALPDPQDTPIIRQRNMDIALAALAQLNMGQLQIVLEKHLIGYYQPRSCAVAILQNVMTDIQNGG
jgi:hypothetical protein